ncbi:putative alpha/beta hydrolase [Pseudomassariella vexata]|uniref:Putative alpha/beta hydrolase n=1 Tax=Pseudomassariella vexata TaxID=1141098 RepID=A0A1Y2DEW0_9PEZI|nr:putative alpha/beta hydrolase [Pseudomassariella vexata]ORY57801.1 putative alpha/beta hydrolase [Pseudomassariella vexata]
MSATVKTISVPHLGIKAGYAFGNDSYDASKPTAVLINSMCMSSALYRAQFSDTKLTDAMNLLAIEPLGHGATTCASEHFTYWDSAIMALQVLDALGISKVFALGTSQGGWVVPRIALLAPERVLGLVLLGTSMDCESADSRGKGCWDPVTFFKPFLAKWATEKETPDFVPDDEWTAAVAGLGFGSFGTQETSDFWTNSIRQVYKGTEGRNKLRIAVINLAERDGLLLRLPYIKCPVHWLAGTDDPVYGTIIPAEQIKLFTSSKDTKLDIIQGGAHYLNATHPREVNSALLDMVKKTLP